MLTAKFVAVLGALLWGFHNAAERALLPVATNGSRSRRTAPAATVYEAIRALEDAGILTWVNRIARIREWGPDLFGRAQNRWRVIRTSNAYTLRRSATQARPPISSKSELPTGTEGQESFPLAPQPLDAANSLHQALQRLGEAVKGAAPTGAASLATRGV